jgi:hypothetical protein
MENGEDQEEQQAGETETDQISEDTDQDITPVDEDINQPWENNFSRWILGGALLVVLGGVLVYFVAAKSRRETPD